MIVRRCLSEILDHVEPRARFRPTVCGRLLERLGDLMRAPSDSRAARSLEWRDNCLRRAGSDRNPRSGGARSKRAPCSAAKRTMSSSSSRRLLPDGNRSFASLTVSATRTATCGPPALRPTTCGMSEARMLALIIRIASEGFAAPVIPPRSLKRIASAPREASRPNSIVAPFSSRSSVVMSRLVERDKAPSRLTVARNFRALSRASSKALWPVRAASPSPVKSVSKPLPLCQRWVCFSRALRSSRVTAPSAARSRRLVKPCAMLSRAVLNMIHCRSSRPLRDNHFLSASPLIARLAPSSIL